MVQRRELEPWLPAGSCSKRWRWPIRIIEGNAQIRRQRKSALRLEAAGYDATDAKSLLRMMEWVLEAMETHRERIRQEVSNAVAEER